MRDPGKQICKTLGTNHKKNIITNEAQRAYSNEITCIRNNNKYVKVKKESGLFGDLKELINYKEWLLLNGPENINSPYFSSQETRTKQKTRVAGLNGHPNIYVGWEDRFDYNAYNKDLSETETAINKCKQSIQKEAEEYSRVINESVYQKTQQEEDLTKAKKLYHYAQNEFNSIIQKNQRLNQEVNENLLFVQDQKSVAFSKTEQFAQLLGEANKVFTTNLDIQNVQETKELLASKIQESVDKISNLTVDERTKLFFKIYGTKKADIFSSAILNKGINLDLLAYLSVQFNNQIVLDYALANGASLDEYFVEGKSTIESMLDFDKYQQILKNYDGGMFCTAISAAENNRINVLKELYKLDSSIFVNNNNKTCCTILHLMVFNDHFEALKYMLSTSTDAINVKSLRGDGLLKSSLRSASNEMSVFLMSNVDNLEEEIKDLIIEDDIDLFLKAISIYELDAKVKLSLVNFIMQIGQFDLVKELLTDPEEIKQIFNESLASHDFLLAEQFYQVFQSSEIQDELDEVLESKDLPEEVKSCFEFFTNDNDLDSVEFLDLLGLEDNTVLL